MSHISNSLVGTWRLASYERMRRDGERTFPLGADCTGMLVYTKDSTVSVQMMRRHRPSIASDNVLGGSVEERAEAMLGYIAYAGRYELLDHETAVLHDIECCLFPNWIGQTQKRYFIVSDNTLALTTPPFEICGDTYVARMVWNRFEAQ